MYNDADISKGLAAPIAACNHNGDIPIEIVPGIFIRLASNFRISKEALAASDILLPLNGMLPQLPFGAMKTILECELKDRGGVPPEWHDFIRSVAQLLRDGYSVAAWCVGSHGRTGCFAASLKAEMDPNCADPIAWIRAAHCTKAVETRAQAEAVFAIKGQTLPTKYAAEYAKETWGLAWSAAPSSACSASSAYGHDLEYCPCAECLQQRTIILERSGGKTFQIANRVIPRSTPCQCDKWANCERDREAYALANPVLPVGVFLFGNPSIVHSSAPWFTGRRYMHDLDCTCSDLCIARKAANPGKRSGTYYRLYPCTCTAFKMCKDERAGFSAAMSDSALKASYDSYLAALASPPAKAKGKCQGEDSFCFCSDCQKKDITDLAHREPASACNCAKCILLFKLEARDELEFIHAASGHAADCLCESCWYATSGHPAECTCGECIWLNIQPPELEEPETAEEAQQGAKKMAADSGLK